MPEPLFQTILEVVARHYGTAPSAILSGSRYKSIILARHTGMYVARCAGDFSYEQIAEGFSVKDHTSVMNACQRMTARAEADPKFGQLLEGLVREVQGLGVSGGKVTIRSELLLLIEKRVKLGIFGRTVEDIVDRILCEHFQRELPKSP